MKYTHILWDWNGTLLDDVMQSIDCVNDLLDKLGKPHTNLKEYYEMMDIPMSKYYENLFKGEPVPYKLCTQNFQQSYPIRIKTASLMSGAEEILKYFNNNNAKQYIVSSFEQSRLNEYVNMFGVTKYFEKISGDKDIHVGNKSTRAIELVKNVNKENILYIGDSEADYNTAKDVGCNCVLICKGHQPRSVLEKFGYPVIDNLLELKDICK